MTEQKPVRYDAFRAKAEKLLDSPVRLQKIVAQATRKLTSQGSGGIQEARVELQTALALSKAWISGDYRDVSNKTMVAVVAAILYFVVPLDVIPDFLLGWGLIDDIAVIGYVFGQVQEEISAFKAWQLTFSNQELKQDQEQTETDPNDPES
jgi:uncharacterized membrane protein YkvA (DUF1232 family)